MWKICFSFVRSGFIMNVSKWVAFKWKKENEFLIIFILRWSSKRVIKFIKMALHPNWLDKKSSPIYNRAAIIKTPEPRINIRLSRANEKLFPLEKRSTRARYSTNTHTDEKVGIHIASRRAWIYRIEAGGWRREEKGLQKWVGFCGVVLPAAAAAAEDHINYRVMSPNVYAWPGAFKARFRMRRLVDGLFFMFLASSDLLVRGIYFFDGSFGNLFDAPAAAAVAQGWMSQYCVGSLIDWKIELCENIWVVDPEVSYAQILSKICLSW